MWLLLGRIGVRNLVAAKGLICVAHGVVIEAVFMAIWLREQ